MPFHWPDSAVAAIAALEKASHEALSSDFQKYNQKMRQLAFNLKVNIICICHVCDDLFYSLRSAFVRWDENWIVGELNILKFHVSVL